MKTRLRSALIKVRKANEDKERAVNCIAVRELLPEHALGVADGDADAVERHLAWCAACRKEARDLHRAAASFAFVLAPAVRRRPARGSRGGAVPHAAGDRLPEGRPGGAARARPP